VILPGACLHTMAWRPHASTCEPQRQTWGTHKLSPSRNAIILLLLLLLLLLFITRENNEIITKQKYTN